VGTELLLDTIIQLDLKKASAKTQDVSKATKAPKIKKEWSELDFKEMSAWKVEQLSRAIGEQYPLRTTYTKQKKKKMRTYTVQLMHLFVPFQPCSLLKTMKPGSWVWHAPSESIHILFKDNTVIACPTIKLEGRAAMLARDFVNGFEHEGVFGLEPMFDEGKRKEKLKLIENMKPFGQ
jgi:methionyl-tRNA formyltransferase